MLDFCHPFLALIAFKDSKFLTCNKIFAKGTGCRQRYILSLNAMAIETNLCPEAVPIDYGSTTHQ